MRAFRSRITAAAPKAVCVAGGKAFEALFPKLRRPGSWGHQTAPRAVLAGFLGRDVAAGAR